MARPVRHVDHKLHRRILGAGGCGTVQAWHLDNVVDAAVVAADELAGDLKLVAEHFEHERTVFVHAKPDLRGTEFRRERGDGGEPRQWGRRWKIAVASALRALTRTQTWTASRLEWRRQICTAAHQVTQRQVAAPHRAETSCASACATCSLLCPSTFATATLACSDQRSGEPSITVPRR